jgi:drug/metabolite transporter (DMT)-like permease
MLGMNKNRLDGTAPETLAPILAIFISTLLWGTWWIPLRALDAAGIGSVWANAAGLTLPLIILLPSAFIHRRHLYHAGGELWRSGFFIAAAISLYAEALLRGYVARTLLLFYLTTVWSTLLGRLMLQQPIDARRLLSITLGIGGAGVIFGADGGLPLPRHIGEWMALLSGFCWALGATFLHQARVYPLTHQAIVQFLFIGPLFMIFALLPGGHELVMPKPAMFMAAAPWLCALAFFWTLPLIVLTLFGASRIDPGKVAILLTFEIVVGVVSAWLLADEPLGRHEVVGALLIMGAVCVEFLSSLLQSGRRPAVSP